MLLQEIYAREAISEAGNTLPLIIGHTEPMKVVGGIDYRLLFLLTNRLRDTIKNTST